MYFCSDQSTLKMMCGHRTKYKEMQPLLEKLWFKIQFELAKYEKDIHSQLDKLLLKIEFNLSMQKENQIA